MTLHDKIARLADVSAASWGGAYGKFAKVIESKKLKVGAEIGVAFAGHANSILAHTTIDRLYGVDPYKHMRGYDDPMNYSQKEFDVLYDFVLKRMATYGKRYKHIRGFSDEAIKTIKTPVDFVYIDADHSYDGVWRDLVAWYPMIKEGGILGGHDYGHVNFPGVKQAIDEFFRRFGWEIHEEGEGVWWVEKGPTPISYIMPAYNAEKTIKASVESIMHANLQPGDELVIVNDCSTDKTADIIKELRKKYPAVRVVEHPYNKGGGAARNTAVEHAKHQLIFCLDSDNILTKNSVPKLRDFLCASGADVASFETLKYFKTRPGQTTHSWRFTDANANLAGALSKIRFPGASGNYLFTRDSWLRAGRYPEDAGALDAWGLGFRQVATDSKMRVLPGSYYHHRYGHDSYWTRDTRTGKLSLRALQLLLPFIDLLDESDIDYVLSKEGRHTWFQNIEQHPIKLKSDQPAPAEETPPPALTVRQRLARKLKHTLKGI